MLFVDVFTAALRWLVCSEMGAEAASRSFELLEHNQLLSTPSRFVELGSFDKANLSELFICVNLNNLSVADLQRLGRVCRELCKKLQANPISGLAHVEAFSEKVIGRCLETGNFVPNIPTAPRNRVPHCRNDTCFSFSHRFYGILRLLESNGRDRTQKSPKFEDEWSNVKWYIRA